MGLCNGIENYLCYFLGCVVGEKLLMMFDYFFEDFLLIIDESYQMVLQVCGMFNGDCVCKEMFVEYGFCLLSVFDNWLLIFDEFDVMVGQRIYVLVMLGDFEFECIGGVIVEQLICLMGLFDLLIDLWLFDGQIDDLVVEICEVMVCKECVFVIMLIKCMVEELM